MLTQFASAARSSQKDVINDYTKFSLEKLVISISEATNSLFMILNHNRQIVFANSNLLSLLGCSNNDILGQRPGEILACINATSATSGCGTHENCRTCGAVNSILIALEGKNAEGECRISSKINNKNVSFDLAVKAQPFEFEKKEYVLFSASDISDKKRKNVLERTFFHDILNTAGGVSGFSELLTYKLKNTDTENYQTAKIINNIADKLIDEIRSQQQLLSAETNDLELTIEEIELFDFLKLIVSIIENHKDVKKCTIKLEQCENISIRTDKVLLQRILVNMIKNAAEAEPENAEIKINANLKKETIIFSIHNDTAIEEKNKSQIFQRSFSTKGENRGTGTYSMKLFGENYLQGHVWFESDKTMGTTFFVEIAKTLENK